MCCGVTESEFLTFDHIAGDGALRCAQGEPMGSRLYQLLKRQGYPRSVLQILCHSCNKAKSFYGRCPHLGPAVARPGVYEGWARRLRERVIAGYGGRCECCGETQQAFLAIDHVHNDGAAERRALGLQGGQWHRWLISAGFPRDRYRLLCHCCNEARALYGVCPHERGGVVRPGSAPGTSSFSEKRSTS